MRAAARLRLWLCVFVLSSADEHAHTIAHTHAHARARARAHTHKNDTPHTPHAHACAVPGAELDGVYPVRVPADSKHIEAAIDAGVGPHEEVDTNSTRVVIMGSSFIGMEVAAYLAATRKGTCSSRGLCAGCLACVGVHARGSHAVRVCACLRAGCAPLCGRGSG